MSPDDQKVVEMARKLKKQLLAGGHILTSWETNRGGSSTAASIVPEGKLSVHTRCSQCFSFLAIWNDGQEVRVGLGLAKAPSCQEVIERKERKRKLR